VQAGSGLTPEPKLPRQGSSSSASAVLSASHKLAFEDLVPDTQLDLAPMSASPNPLDARVAQLVQCCDRQAEMMAALLQHIQSVGAAGGQGPSTTVGGMSALPPPVLGGGNDFAAQPAEAASAGPDDLMGSVSTAAIEAAQKSKSLSAQVKSKVTSEVAKLTKKLDSFNKSALRIDKLKANKAPLVAGSIPSDTKPYKFPFVTPLSETAIGDLLASSVGLGLQSDATFDSARRAVHIDYLLKLVLLDLDLEEKRHAELTEACPLEAFLTICKTYLQSEHEEIVELSGKIKPPPGLFCPLSEKLELYAVNAYCAVIEKNAKALADLKRKSEKQKLDDAKTSRPLRSSLLQRYWTELSRTTYPSGLSNLVPLTMPR